MCGIAGVFEREDGYVEPGLLARMTRTLVHRGPDEEGYYFNGPTDVERVSPEMRIRGPRAGVLSPTENTKQATVGLGHRRLSILDLGSGQQPLGNEDGSVWVSFNGEIYNFQELQRELEACGHRFRTRCDTETIVHAYEQWGYRAVEKFRGMFAFAVWDERRQSLWLARDRVGKKPLYYALNGSRFLFGSEVKAVLQDATLPRDVDLTAFSDYLSLLYVPGEKTILRDVKKLPAAHYAIVARDRLEVRQYWDLCFEPVSERSDQALIEEMMSILEQATRLRMISDVPLGAFLSGGVDSSAVVALMATLSEDPVITNSISFSEKNYNEVEYARELAGIHNTNHHEWHVTPEAVPVIEKLSWNYDEPFADSSAVPTYYVSKTARERVTVALSGDGGDENFAGYRRYYFDLRENAVRNWVPAGMGRALFRLLGRLYPKADYLPQVFRGKAFVSNVARDPVDAYFFSVSAMDDVHKRDLIHPDVLGQLEDYRTVDRFRRIYHEAPAVDHLSKLQYLDIRTYLCDDILTKVDRASMAVSLEVRCPILDHRFMESVARIPANRKLVGRDGKHIFKRALKGLVPNKILYRPKMGFGVPIMEWLRKDLGEYAHDLVFKGEATRLFLNEETLRRMWTDHQRGLRNRATELWSVMMLNLWYRRFGSTSSGEA